MQLTDSYIVLTDLRFHAYHGVLEQEKIVGNDYLLTLRLQCDLTQAIQSDDVKHTVSYADAYEVVKQSMQTPCSLLEKAAGNIARSLFTAFPSIKALAITLTKVNPPMNADCAGASIELHLINDKNKAQLS